MDTKSKNVYKAVEKIHSIVADFREVYPELKQKKTTRIDNPTKAVKIISSIERIIKNYNNNNAETKLKNIIRMLGKEIVR